jgi:hypothetical protein
VLFLVGEPQNSVEIDSNRSLNDLAFNLLRIYKNQSLEYIRIDTSRCGSGKFFPVELMYADYQENYEFKELVCI